MNSYQYTCTYDFNNFEQGYSDKSWNNAGTKVTSGDSSYYYYHTVLGINDLIVQDGSIIVYPNPSSGRFTISSNSPITSIEIYNLLGERIYSDFNFAQKTLIDLSGYHSGIYLIKIYSGSKNYNRKIIVQ